MRILIFNQTAAPVQGEMNPYVLDIAARLRDEGETVALVHGRTPKSEFEGTGYIFDHLRESLADDADVRVRLDAIMDDFAPDIIQIQGVTNTKIDAWLSARAPTVRFIHTHRFYCSGLNMTWQTPRRICQLPHGRSCLLHHALNRCGSKNVAANFLRYRRVGKALEHFKSLHGLQVASESMRENLVRNGIPPEQIELIPLYAAPPLAPKMKSKTAGRIILHHGGLLKKKGVWLLTKSLRSLPKDVSIVFAGGGVLQDALESYVKSHGLSERIRIMGDLTPLQWSHLYHQASLIAIPSVWNEPLGLAGIHAMAHGKPVVAFRSGGISEWLEDGVTGIAVPFGERAQFVKSVQRLLDDPDLSAQLGANGRKIWTQKFQPQHHIENLRAYYERIIAKK